MAQQTIWYLALFPTSFYFSVVYTEGLFLLLTVSAFYCAQRGWWLPASLLGALSAATRFVGALLIIPLAYEWFQQKPRNWKYGLTLLIIPCGLLAYMLYLQLNNGSPKLSCK